MSNVRKWRRFCANEGLDSDAVGLARAIVQHPDRLDAFLQDGLAMVGSSEIRLRDLDVAEWVEFDRFVASYRREWQSYFHPLMYRAYYAEVERRGLPQP